MREVARRSKVGEYASARSSERYRSDCARSVSAETTLSIFVVPQTGDVQIERRANRAFWQATLPVKSHRGPMERAAQWSSNSRRVNTAHCGERPLPKFRGAHHFTAPDPIDPLISMASTGAEPSVTSFLDGDRPELNRRVERSVRNQSVCYRFLKWIVLSISSTFVVSIQYIITILHLPAV